MSALNPKGVKITLGPKGLEREYELLFTLNAIDKIQDAAAATLPQVLMEVASTKDANSIRSLKLVLSVLLTDYAERMNDPLTCIEKRPDLVPVSEASAGRLVTEANWPDVVSAIIEAYGLSMPQKEDEDDDPNRASGTTNN